jgi:hypothetical protein
MLVQLFAKMNSSEHLDPPFQQLLEYIFQQSAFEENELFYIFVFVSRLELAAIDWIGNLVEKEDVDEDLSSYACLSIVGNIESVRIQGLLTTIALSVFASRNVLANLQHYVTQLELVSSLALTSSKKALIPAETSSRAKFN